MSFFERLEKVRARPEAERRQITFWASAGITALVAAIWVVNLSFTLSAPSMSQVVAVGAMATSSLVKSSGEDNGVNFFNSNKVK
jgi:hypothetical protein